MNVSPKEETVWLPLNDICLLFDRDKSVISRHIKTVIMENDLDEKKSCCKKCNYCEPLDYSYRCVCRYESAGFLETRFSKKMEHVFLVDFNAWLVEWVDLVKVSAHGTSSLEEVEEIAKIEWVHFL